MELWHYTDREILANIKECGLLTKFNDTSTQMINEYLMKQNTSKKDSINIRSNSIFFYNIQQYDEYELPKDVLEIMILATDLDTDKLYVANWKYAEWIYGLLKGNQKDVEEQLVWYANAYIDSIKKFESVEDLYLYDSTECFYGNDIPYEKLSINGGENE